MERDAFDAARVHRRSLEGPNFGDRSDGAQAEDRQVDFARAAGESHFGENRDGAAKPDEIARRHAVAQDGLTARPETYGAASLVVDHGTENAVPRHLGDEL